jgi:hypothetical protein
MKELEAAGSVPIFEPGKGGTRCGLVWRALERLQETPRIAASRCPQPGAREAAMSVDHIAALTA